jgi:hypothetical protein
MSMNWPTRAMRWSSPGWRATAFATVVWVVLAAVGRVLFPRLARWMQWPRGLTLRGRLAYAFANAALAFALTELKNRLLRSREELVAELREELGREPTPEEIQRRLATKMVRAALEEKLGRAPTPEELRDVLGDH